MIEEFINRRFPTDCNWMSGNCYYFALILANRFPNLQVVYLPVDGHFMAYDASSDIGYDFLGAHKNLSKSDRVISWAEIQRQDPDWTHRLMRDCIY